jgi:DedD protein
MAGNRPARERFEFSLDARQVAAITLGSLVALALAFFLGNALGKRVAERPARAVASAVPAAPADPLSVLDQAPRPDGGEPAPPLSFHDALTGSKPPPDRLPPAPRPQPPPAAEARPAAGPTGTAAGASPVPPAPAASAAPAPAAPPSVAEARSAATDKAAPAPAKSAPASPKPAPAKPAPSPAQAKAAAAPRLAPGKGAFVVQVGSTQERIEADRIAARFATRGAKVTVAEVPGKGRWYRVRLGSFDTREAADRYLRDLERTTGAKGFVAPAN